MTIHCANVKAIPVLEKNVPMFKSIQLDCGQQTTNTNQSMYLL